MKLSDRTIRVQSINLLTSVACRRPYDFGLTMPLRQHQRIFAHKNITSEFRNARLVLKERNGLV